MRSIIALWLTAILVFACGTQTYTHSATPQAKSFPDVKSVSGSVYKVTTTLGFVTPTGIQAEQFVGTAWVIASNSKQSILATAGHVCHAVGEKDPNGTQTRNIDAVLMQVNYFNEDTEVQVIYKNALDDTCLLRANFHAPALDLAKSPPTEGDKVWYLGYPAQSRSIVTGYFVENTSDGYQNSSCAAYGGASGSPMLDSNNQVFGILVQVNGYFQGATYATSYKALQMIYVIAYASLKSNS